MRTDPNLVLDTHTTFLLPCQPSRLLRVTPAVVRNTHDNVASGGGWDKRVLKPKSPIFACPFSHHPLPGKYPPNGFGHLHTF